MNEINQEMVDQVTQELLDENQEDSVHEAIAEMVPEFLDEDWEDEFDSEEEAYIEQGRGEAEDQILNDMISKKQAVYNFSLNDFCEIHDNLQDMWCL